MIKLNTHNNSGHLLTTVGMVITFGILIIASSWSIVAIADNSRIVAIDGSLTEIIYALGDGDKVVGRDTTTTYPPEALKLPSVGYMRALSAEGILSLKPSLIIATTDAKPRSVLDQLKQAGVRVELITNEFTLAGVKEKIRQVAKLLNREKKGEILINEMQLSIDKAQSIAKTKKIEQGMTTAIYVLGMRGGNMLVAGSNNRASKMIELAGINNPATNDFKGYKPLTAEAAIKYNPQFIITSMHGVNSSGGTQAMLDAPAVRMTEAGKNKQLIMMDRGFLAFGPRLGQAIEDLVTKVYPQ